MLPVSPTDVARQFWDYMGCLRSCVSGSTYLLTESDLDHLYRPAWMLREMFRVGTHHVRLPDDSSSREAMHYVWGCLGHRVERDILRHPRLCALWAGVHHGGRWVRCEDVVGGDHFAMYMYASRVVRGRLPSPLHNRMVMESYLGVTPAMRLYFDHLG